MKVTVTPVCVHGDGFFGQRGEPFTGTSAVVNRDGVWIDGRQVIARDRRPVAKRSAGHPWLETASTLAERRRPPSAWTGFRIEVDT